MTTNGPHKNFLDIPDENAYESWLAIKSQNGQRIRSTVVVAMRYGVGFFLFFFGEGLSLPSPLLITR